MEFSAINRQKFACPTLFDEGDTEVKARSRRSNFGRPGSIRPAEALPLDIAWKRSVRDSRRGKNGGARSRPRDREARRTGHRRLPVSNPPNPPSWDYAGSG